MAADVSTLIRILGGGGYKEEKQQHRTAANDGEKSSALITRDLLGGGSSVESQELDLDLQVPTGWEKRLDLQVRFNFHFLSIFRLFPGKIIKFPLPLQNSIQYFHVLLFLLI